eukprot:TRINITY_DN30114_c0_g1_i1.p1 TRINITY_DN30114_c0_g1~~TRINITY_DN30114_c0_g1_i1.p1  ORF type:complete len:488 (-),score=73.03 TRINITY_DN30114_c0_g1_i1:240-1703(-)
MISQLGTAFQLRPVVLCSRLQAHQQRALYVSCDKWYRPPSCNSAKNGRYHGRMMLGATIATTSALLGAYAAGPQQRRRRRTLHTASPLLVSPGRSTLRAVACQEGPQSGKALHPVTGAQPGPYPVGVTTMQLDDRGRLDVDGGPRRLQTEIWYPAGDESRSLPVNRYSEFLARGAKAEYIERAEDKDAIGGYKAGLTIADLDKTWLNLAKRDARPREPDGADERWPVIIFSHGNGAFRGSYVYFTEFLASQGYVVVACDHPGSSRYTILDGEVVKAGGLRGDDAQRDRPLDVVFLLDALERMNLGADSRFAGRLDTSRSAVTGMSFGGWTTAKVLDMGDPRVKAAIIQCPSLMRGELSRGINVPTMIMLGTEDTVVAERGNSMARNYFDSTLSGPKYSVEIKKGGHVTFTSCELYNANYGNGIGRSKSLTNPGEMYDPLPPTESHEIINMYALALLDWHLKGRVEAKAYLSKNHFGDRIIYKCDQPC